MKIFSLSIEVGYEFRSISLTEDELKQIRAGQRLTKEMLDMYEGEEYTYIFEFNQDPDYSLKVSYQQGDDIFTAGHGYLGNINDAIVLELE
jgi:hypothetical protein